VVVDSEREFQAPLSCQQIGRNLSVFYDNKTDLFHFLADTCVNIGDKIVVMTSDSDAYVKLCSGAIDVSSIEPCSREEADTRLILQQKIERVTLQ